MRMMTRKFHYSFMEFDEVLTDLKVGDLVVIM